ncbi:MAG: MFS transporter [Gordonia sp. (in: high G+C Gram-positive bacteria)]|uniref:MFS transporter n=1 Tax=Gordonia sp. (in: high G+C Gram-positive bacteria) TaxID=84139 RepID=UPI0039E4012D
MTLIDRLSPRISSTAPSPSPADAGEIRSAVALLLLATVACYVPTTLYPAYQDLFGFDDLVLMVIYAAMSICAAPALLLFGQAADALGRRLVILSGIALVALGTACFLVATGPAWLIAGRIVQGIALAAVTAGGTALIIERTPPERRARASFVVTAAFVGGSVAGNLVSGLVAEYIPRPRHTAFVLLLALLTVLWFRARRIRPTPAMGLREWRPVRPEVPREIRTRFALAVASASTAWLAVTLFLSVIPALLARSAGVTGAAVIGLVLAAMLACSLVTQPFVLRVSTERLQRVGLPLLAVALIGLAIDRGESSAITLACAVVAGLGHGVAYGGATASIDEVTTERNRGSVNAAFYLFAYLATGTPAVLVGLLSTRIPLDAALATIAWCGVAAAVLTISGFAVVGGRARLARLAFDGRPDAGGS